MSDRITQGRKKASTLNFSTPSLVSTNTPTLANPIRGFGLPTNNPPIPTETDAASNQKEAQFADEQSLIPEINEPRPPTHDISRISLRRPQAKFTVSQPGDPYEQEADRVATQVMRMSIPQTVEVPVIQPIQDSLQRKCAACLEEEEELQTKTWLQPASNSELQTGNNLESNLNSSKGGGSPLTDEVRSFMEPRFGTNFDNVRVHTNAKASQMNQELYAQAFTHGSDIYFGAGKSPGNNELTAHELTHVVQQTGAKTLQRQSANSLVNKTAVQAKLSPVPIASIPHSTIQAQPQTNKVQLKCSACEEEERLQPKAIAHSITPQKDNKSIQKGGLDNFINNFGSAANRVGDTVSAGVQWAGDQASDVVAMGKDAFASLVERVAPDLANLIRQGPMGLLGEKIKEGIKSWISSITGNIDVAGIIEQLQGSFTEVFAAVQGVVKGDPASCQNFANSLKALQDLGNAFMENAAFKQMQAVFSQVNGIFRKVTDLVIAPVFDTLMDVAGGVFNAVKGLATTIWNWGAPIRNTLGAAWDWVKEQLGIGGDGEGGILGWLKAKASAVWTEIKGTLAPVIGPLNTVGTVLLTLSPVGRSYLIIKYLPEIVKSVEWLWAHKDDPDIVKKAHEEMGGTILPQLLSTVEGFGQTMQSTVTSLLNQAIQVSEAVLELLGAISGVPLLSMAQNMVQTVSNGVKGFITWCQEGFQSAAKSVQELASLIATKIKPYIGVLTSIGMAIVNPGMIPVILAGWAWQALDKCYKIPIINFLLDIVIAALQAAPSLPMFGLLWPMIKAGVLGFLQGMKGKSDDEKVAITNKLAKIISGGSPSFILGFVKGLLKAIWEGLTDPFILMYEAVKGLSNLITWLNDVANQALSITPTNQQAAPAQEGGAAPANTANNNAELGQRMLAMAGELQPPVEQVGQGFMPAIQEIFSGGDGMSFEELMQKLGEAWGAVETALTNAGATLADKVCQFMLQDSAEGEMGETVGWLAGTIAFEILLSILTAGTDKPVRGAMKVLKTFAKILDWPGQALELAFKGLAKVGGFVLDAIKGLGKLLNKAGGAAKVMMEALGDIGRKLISFAEELLGITKKTTKQVIKQSVEEIVEKYGAKGVEFLSKHGDEAAEFLAHYGDDAFNLPADKIDSFLGWKKTLTPETQKIFQDNPELWRVYTNMEPDVRKVLTLCSSPCIPPSATAEQANRIKELLSKSGLAADHIGLKKYFHSAKNLDAAISKMDDIAGQINGNALDALLSDKKALEAVMRNPDVAALLAKHGDEAVETLGKLANKLEPSILDGLLIDKKVMDVVLRNPDATVSLLAKGGDEAVKTIGQLADQLEPKILDALINNKKALEAVVRNPDVAALLAKHGDEAVETLGKLANKLEPSILDGLLKDKKVMDVVLRNPDATVSLLAKGGDEAVKTIGQLADQLEPKILDALINNKKALEAVVRNSDAVALLGKHGDEAVKALGILGDNGVDILKKYDKISHIPGAPEVLKDLAVGSTTTKGAIGEIKHIERLLDEGIPIAKVGDKIGGQKAADIILANGTIIDVKYYNWDKTWPFSLIKDPTQPLSPSKQKLFDKGLKDRINEMIKQVNLRKQQYPGAPIEYAFKPPLKDVPVELIEALEKEGVKVVEGTL